MASKTGNQELCLETDDSNTGSPDGGSVSDEPVHQQTRLAGTSFTSDERRLPGRSTLPTVCCNVPFKIDKSSSSDGPAVCRICHGGEMSSPFTSGAECLISPCFCSGTMGLYHRSCLEKWLSTSNTAQCEICKFQYVTQRHPKPLLSFLLNPGSVAERRSMIGDLVCWCVLTPLAFASTFLCIEGAVHYSKKGRDQVEVPGLICLAVFLVLTYFIWLSVSLRYHYKVWREWQKKNQVVKIVDMEDGKYLIEGFETLPDGNNNLDLPVPETGLVPSHSMASVAARPPNHTSTPTNPTSATVTIRFDYTPSGYYDSGPLHETVV